MLIDFFSLKVYKYSTSLIVYFAGADSEILEGEGEGGSES